jgi:hypothetical protein
VAQGFDLHLPILASLLVIAVTITVALISFSDYYAA